jgi:hypothetical protein
MSESEDVERKVDPEAELQPEAESGTGDLLTSSPSGATVARWSLALFLFGGLVLLVAGAGLWAYENLGIYVTLAVAGVGSILFAWTLAQVYARRGIL